MKEQKIVQLIAAPGVKAIYKDDETGKEFANLGIVYAALFSDGEVSFIDIGADGIWEVPENISNFVEYRFDTNEQERKGEKCQGKT